jgi:hypothetical protein
MPHPPPELPPHSALHRLLQTGAFLFEDLRMEGIDNEPVYAINGPELREQERCLVSAAAATGDAAVAWLGDRVEAAIANRTALPVVRFADGEYLFYSLSMKCNGLYQQAESVEAIRAALPAHYEAMRAVARTGVLAPLVFPGNVRRGRRSIRRFWKKPKSDQTALHFLDALAGERVPLDRTNFVPFYAVYAYLSGRRFARSLHDKVVGVINSDYRPEACAAWFARRGSVPKFVHVPISNRYVATGWHRMREAVLSRLDPSVDLWMVGAGIGALQVCLDVAQASMRPAIDSGHIVNAMNDLESKSNGPRLYTHGT